MKDAVKAGMLPGQLFENLGFRYFGPVDGHDLPELMEMLNGLKNVEGPRLLHVLTEKGHGHESAVADPFTYHAVKPAPAPKPKDKVSKSGKTAAAPSYTKVFGDAAAGVGGREREGRRDHRGDAGRHGPARVPRSLPGIATSTSGSASSTRSASPPASRSRA